MFCYFVIILHLYIRFSLTETRDMKSRPSREFGTTGGGFNIHRNCLLFSQFKLSPIFLPRFSNGHVDYVGVSEAAIWQPFYGTLQFRWDLYLCPLFIYELRFTCSS